MNEQAGVIVEDTLGKGKDLGSSPKSNILYFLTSCLQIQWFSLSSAPHTPSDPAIQSAWF